MTLLRSQTPRLAQHALLALAAAALLSACAVSTSEAPKAAAGAAPAATPDPWLRPALVPHPPDNAPTLARVELGRKLFFEPRLSGSGVMTCATCHNPSLGWSDGLARAVGHGHKTLGRATPTIVNTAYQPVQMWDGRKPTLEAQALGPIEASDEMNLPLGEALARLNAIPGYAEAFERAYPGEGITATTLGKALASFERTVVSGEAPFDRWRRGDDTAISPAAKRGFEVFQGKANCALCHSGFNFTDNGFHNIGLNVPGDSEGRFAHRRVKVLKGAFKTPTLREIDATAPYMRNGAYATLEAVVDHYDRGGDDKTNLSPNMKPLNLSASEKADLVSFMKTLTSPRTTIVMPTLPPSVMSAAAAPAPAAAAATPISTAAVAKP